MRGLVTALLLAAGPAEAGCRQALALGLDVSGSVDPREYRLQLDGLAGALGSPDVRELLLAQPDAPVRIAVFEWSGPESQAVILPWTELGSEEDLVAALGTIRGAQRRAAELTTAIGTALLTGFALLEEQPDCWRRTLDISGDGPNNTGPRPQDVGEEMAPAGVTVNALVIGGANLPGDDHRQADIKELSSYFREYVARGPGAFVETALGYEDYEAAMRRKLLRELASLAIGEAR